MGYETLLFEVEDSVGVITLNRPDRHNAWTHTMGQDLGDALSRCNDDDGVRAVVITGAGRAFCAGADLQSGGDTFAGRDGDSHRPRPMLPNQVAKPVIAAINGPAVGVGITMPMLCDMRFVAEDAKVSFAFTRRGMIPEFTSHYVVQRLAGFAAAADVLLSGRMLLGRELADLGIANESLPKDEVLPRAMEKARDYVNTAPVSVAITKRLLWESMDLDYAALREKEDKLFAWAGDQADAREGIESFLEKRSPSWKMSAANDLPEGL